MRLFKFTAGGSAVIELIEDVGFNDTGYYFNFSNQLTEDIGFNEQSAWADIYDSIEETIGFDELVSVLMEYKVFEPEEIGFNDEGLWFDYNKTLNEDVGFIETAVDLEVLSEECEEDVGFGESMQVIAGLYVELTETVGFNDEGNHASLLELLDETVGFTEESELDTIVVHALESIGFTEDYTTGLLSGTELIETIGFQDEAYETGNAYMGDGDGSNPIDLDGDGIPDTNDNGADVVGFNDSVEISIMSADVDDDVLEFVDYGYIVDGSETSITFTWESRVDPENHPTGYGNVHWGDTWSEGDTFAKYSFFARGLHPGLRQVDDDPDFVVHCIPYHAEISITNTSDPDASASYTYYPHTTFGYIDNFWVEIFTRDENNKWSLALFEYVSRFDDYVWTRTMDWTDFYNANWGTPWFLTEHYEVYLSELLDEEPPQ